MSLAQEIQSYVRVATKPARRLLAPFTRSIPKGAGVLFFIQIFSTLSFSVLYSTLVLYLTENFGLDDDMATSMIATFVAFNFALHLIGGFIGGRWISYRGLFSIGMILSALGCVFISFDNMAMLYWGLAIFLVASGMNVTCINCMLTQLFRPDDKRRESAFLWNYSGMNIGFLLGFILAGHYQLEHNFARLFLVSGAGNLVALLIALANFRILRDVNTFFSQAAYHWRSGLYATLIIILLALGLRILLEHAEVSTEVVSAIGVVMAGVIAYFAMTQRTSIARRKMWAYYALAIAALIFWTIYQMMPMGLTLFIDRNVNREVFNMIIAPQWFPTVNTIVIIIGGPITAWAFTRLRARGFRVSIPFLFAMALTLIGLSMLSLTLGIHFSDARGLTNPGWVVFCYFLWAVGELLISPVGYAMVGQLAPVRLRGILMGTWLMLTGVAAAFSHMFSDMALGHTLSHSPLATNMGYFNTFTILGWAAILFGVLMFLLVPYIVRLMQEK